MTRELRSPTAPRTGVAGSQNSHWPEQAAKTDQAATPGSGDQLSGGAGQSGGTLNRRANNVEIAYAPTNSSWLNRIEAQSTALRYFTLDGTDHASHKEKASIIRWYIIWQQPRLRRTTPPNRRPGQRSLTRH
jgi:hypothetical protein